MAPGSAKLFVIASNINPDENEVLSAEQQAALVASRGGDFIYAYYYGFRKIGEYLNLFIKFKINIMIIILR